jgi:serine protease Do
VLPAFGVAALGDSSAVRSGQWAIALGDPAGPEKFFGVGTFASGPSRDCYQELRSSFYLQAALSVPPEAYGGPLVNIAGEVLGILSPRDPRPGPAASAAPPGIEFALPSNIVIGLYDTIRQKGSFRSPWLGFSVMSRSELMHAQGAEAFEALEKPRSGIYIENVFDPSPAFAAGVRPGDFLVRFDGVDIRAPVDFQRQLYLAGIGGDARLELFHAGTSRTLSLHIEERPPEAHVR